jgi:hypothetical protein
MMIEFEDHSPEQQEALLRYLDQLKAQQNVAPSPEAPKPGHLRNLIGRLCIAYWRWRYRRRN